MTAATYQLEASSEEIVVAEQFVCARLKARAMTDYPGSLPVDLASAYRSQEAAIARIGEPIGGWKVTAEFSPALQAQYNERRMIGPAFASNIRVAGAGEIVECPVFENGFAAFEPEIVIRVGTTASADKIEWTIDDAITMIGDLYVGVEIASSPLPTLLQLGAAALASDFGGNFGIVVGPSISGWRDLKNLGARCFIDDQLVGEGEISIREGPLTAFAHVLSACARRGRPLRAGALITTGTITYAHHIRPGQSSRFIYDHHGELRCHAVAASPRR